MAKLRLQSSLKSAVYTLYRVMKSKQFNKNNDRFREDTMKRIQIAIGTALCLSSLSVNADILGTLSGRSANPANSPQLSVEGSFNTSGDYQNIGARVNYTVNDK